MRENATRRRRKARGRRDGFSLIEILITLAVVASLIVGAAELLVQAVRIKIKADGNLEMTDLTASRLEELKSPGRAAADGVVQEFKISGRRDAFYDGSCEFFDPGGGSLSSVSFELYPELEPEAVLALVLFISKDLGF